MASKTRTRKKKAGVHDGVTIRGFYRLHIEEDGKIVGDSGWYENNITNLGIQFYLAAALAALANSSQISFAGIGTGTAPGDTDTTLDGEVTGTSAQVWRASVVAASNGSTAVRFTGTFSSNVSFVTTTENISNIGLFRSSTGGTLFAGNTYAGSSVGTNQNVNFTYEITFAG